MNTAKHIGIFAFIAALLMVSNACGKKSSEFSHQELSGTSGNKFTTIIETPQTSRSKLNNSDEILSDTLITNELLPPSSAPLDIPPIATDDEFLEAPDYRAGPTIAPYARCGNGRVEPLEQCDLGPENSNAGGVCNVICEKPYCGNGITERGEECDDGDHEDGDGCTKRCLFERCGNARLDCGEQCDDGNKDPMDGCSACCMYEECGNGVQDPGEQCDDGDTENGDGCDDCCKMEMETPPDEETRKK